MRASAIHPSVRGAVPNNDPKRECTQSSLFLVRERVWRTNLIKNRDKLSRASCIMLANG